MVLSLGNSTWLSNSFVFLFRPVLLLLPVLPFFLIHRYSIWVRLSSSFVTWKIFYPMWGTCVPNSVKLENNPSTKASAAESACAAPSICVTLWGWKCCWISSGLCTVCSVCTILAIWISAADSGTELLVDIRRESSKMKCLNYLNWMKLNQCWLGDKSWSEDSEFDSELFFQVVTEEEILGKLGQNGVVIRESWSWKLELNFLCWPEQKQVCLFTYSCHTPGPNKWPQDDSRYYSNSCWQWNNSM